MKNLLIVSDIVLSCYYTFLFDDTDFFIIHYNEQ